MENYHLETIPVLPTTLADLRTDGLPMPQISEFSFLYNS